MDAKPASPFPAGSLPVANAPLPREISSARRPTNARSDQAAAPAGSDATRPPAYAVVQVEDFALQAIVRISPDLSDRPVALLASDRKRATVTALNPAARRHGVVLGLTAPQAQARCSELHLLTPQPAAEKEAHAALLAAAFTLSPTVEATAAGVVTADVSGLPFAQRETALTDAIARLATLGLTATAGLAGTPLLAWYAARVARPVLRVEDIRGFLAPLPLATAEPPAEIAPVLASWGLRTLGDLTALSKADIVQRLGPAGLALWERAAGETTRPLTSVVPDQTFTAGLELEHPVETLEPLLFLLRRFLDRLVLDLTAAGWVAAEISLTLTLEDETTYARAFRLPEPTAEPEILFRTLHSHLETVHTAAAVIAVTLALEPARPLARQHGLFDTGLRDPHGFAETLARTVAVMGSGRVGTPHCDNTHRPDAFTLGSPAPVVPPADPPPILPPLGLVLRRFRPVLAARVELTAPALLPAYVWSETLQGAVTERRGPWRGSGDWWQQGVQWEREEWDVALAGGGLYRLVRTPAGWWLEGEYD